MGLYRLDAKLNSAVDGQRQLCFKISIINERGAIMHELTFRELEFLTRFFLTEFFTLYHSWISG